MAWFEENAVDDKKVMGDNTTAKVTALTHSHRRGAESYYSGSIPDLASC